MLFRSYYDVAAELDAIRDEGDNVTDLNVLLGRLNEDFIVTRANRMGGIVKSDSTNTFGAQGAGAFLEQGANFGANNSSITFTRKTTDEETGEEVLGHLTKVKIVKNKVAPPFRRAEFDIMFGEGISKVGEIIDLGVEHGIIKKSGSWFSYGETKLGQGRDAVKQLLADNPELTEELEAKIVEVLKKKAEE